MSQKRQRDLVGYLRFRRFAAALLVVAAAALLRLVASVNLRAVERALAELRLHFTPRTSIIKSRALVAS
jgi:hypothetical protein